MNSYRDLEIYKDSYKLAISVHKLTLKLPKYELHEEGSQLRRSSKGIVSCIVEGYGRRKYKAEFIRFLIYAHGSCDETINHLRMVADTHDILSQESHSFADQYDLLGGKINRFLRYVERGWRAGSELQEEL
jgi:four helix bundle protein